MERFTIDQQVFLCGMDNLCNELEREIRSNPASRGRISGYIASLISNLCSLGELKREIGLQSNEPFMLENIEEDVKKAEFERKIRILRNVYEVLTKLKNLVPSALPLSKFHCPSDKRRNKAITEEMQQAERELNKFLGRD